MYRFENKQISAFLNKIPILSISSKYISDSIKKSLTFFLKFFLTFYIREYFCHNGKVSEIKTLPLSVQNIFHKSAHRMNDRLPKLRENEIRIF